MLLQQQQIYNFLRSLSIKFSPIADSVNTLLIQKGIEVNELDPTTWKYYLNMVGEYHSSDTPMYVTSLDTRQKILFSIPNLAINPATAQAYTPGGKYYNRLCTIYPEQVDLIKSILFPVPSMSAAIAAPDFTLLNYGNGFLEEWEQPKIIMEIEKFLNIYVDRWYFDFLDDEPYFHITAWSSLWTYLAMLIMSTRLELIKTPYVHSWHIWQYLQTKGVGDYSDILNRKQSMMLYQNIDYLKANAGKQSNLIVLADNLLADFDIGLYGRRVVQEAETYAGTYQLNPQLEAVRIPTSYGEISAEIQAKTVSEMQGDIFALGLTPSESVETVQAVERKLGNTTLNDYMTKFLEIRPIPKNVPFAQDLSNFMMETLVVSIVNGYYKNAIKIVEPISGDIMYLTPSEALALYSYAINQSLTITNDVIPSTAILYQSFTTDIGTPDSVFLRGDEKYLVSSQYNASDILSGLSYNTNISIPTDFSTMASNLWDKYLTHMLLDMDTSLEKRYEILKYLMTFCHQYRQVTMDLVPGYTSYSAWLGSNGLNIEQDMLSAYAGQKDPLLSWDNLALAIITALIPSNSTISTYTDLTLSRSDYARLSQLFINMCSYRVLFIESDPSTPTFNMGYRFITKWDPTIGNLVAYDRFSMWQNITTTQSSVLETTLDQGWKKDITTDIQNVESASIGTTTTIVSSTTSGHCIRPRVMKNSITTTTTTGSVNLRYAPMSAALI